MMLALAGLASACGNVQNNNSQKASTALANPDFAKTMLSAPASAPADGLSVMTVKVSLLNSDMSPVIGYTPEFVISSGTGKITGQCGRSDAGGVALCGLTANQPGSKTMQLTNARAGLSIALPFNAPSGDQLAATVSGALQARTSDGYKLSVSFGAPVQRFNAKTLDGYTVRVSTSGTRTP